MFGIFKNKGVGSALDECQAYHKKIGLGQELTHEQLVSIKVTPLFLDIESIYKSKGLTKYGGLAAFSAQLVGNIVSAKKNGDPVSDQVMDVAQKMAHVAVAIGVGVPGLKLTRADMIPIEAAANITMEWAKMNPLMNELAQVMKQN